VNPSYERKPWLAPGPADLTLDAPRLLVEIPAGYASLQREDPALALDWRMSSRAIFQHYFACGYRVVDFFLSRDAGRGQYLVVRK
jgi:predicted GNAT superfamily acetyltransferase